MENKTPAHVLFGIAVALLSAGFSIASYELAKYEDRQAALEANPAHIRYVEDERSGLCFAYQYNVGLLMLDCAKVPAWILERKR